MYISKPTMPQKTKIYHNSYSFLMSGWYSTRSKTCEKKYFLPFKIEKEKWNIIWRGRYMKKKRTCLNLFWSFKLGSIFLLLIDHISVVNSCRYQREAAKNYKNTMQHYKAKRLAKSDEAAHSQWCGAEQLDLSLRESNCNHHPFSRSREKEWEEMKEIFDYLRKIEQEKWRKEGDLLCGDSMHRIRYRVYLLVKTYVG